MSEFYCTGTPSKIINPEEVSCETVIVNISAASFRNLEKDYYRNKANEWQTRVWVFTFADSVQSLPLHFVFISQGHGVTRRTVGRHSTAGTSPPQPRILTRSRHLVHRQHCSPGHTALAHTPARRENKSIWIYKAHAEFTRTHTHDMDKQKAKNTQTWEGIKESLTTKSLSLLLTKNQGSCRRQRQRISELHRDSAGDKVAHLL